MARSESRDHRRRLLGWLVALATAAGWVLLLFATNGARAQEGRVPDFVLAQVLGEFPPSRVPSREAVAPPEVSLVASRMRADFEDQLIAGVSRPSVELEVHFDWDSAEIKGDSQPQIEAAARVLNQHFPQTRFRVAGFTDDSGEVGYNQDLSERRANAVWQVLVEEHGVEASRLDRVGYGEENPLGEVEAEQRRRVELQILREQLEGP